jgi:hypothetical protein
MSRRVAAALCAVLFLTCAGQASASVYEITVQGTITGQTAYGSEPGVNVGDVLKMTTRFEAEGPPVAYPAGPTTRYQWSQASGDYYHLWKLPTTGAEFWRIDGDGFTWQSSDDYLDGDGGPNIYLDSAGHFRGARAWLDRSGSATVPYLILQGIGFTLTGGKGLYANTSDPGTFSGSWDWGDAIVKIDGVEIPQGVTAVPEPSAWALLVGGFAMMGGLLRRSRARRAAEGVQSA